MLGMHYALGPLQIQQIPETGMSTLLVSALTANFAQGGAAFGVFLSVIVLFAEMGFKCFRMSIVWSRICPKGMYEVCSLIMNGSFLWMCSVEEGIRLTV